MSERQTPPRLAVFDCDGTLVDSQHTIVAAMTAAWRSRGLSAPSSMAVRRVIGLTLPVAVARLAPDQVSAEHEALAAAYRDAFHALHAEPHEDPLYPGVREVLDTLAAAGVLLGVATGKGTRGLRTTLDKHALTDRFVTLQTADVARGKPDPQMLLRAMEEAGVAAAQTVMIGDTVYDMEMALNARVTAIGVSWGYHPAAELTQAGAVAVIDAFHELPPCFDIHTGIR